MNASDDSGGRDRAASGWIGHPDVAGGGGADYSIRVLQSRGKLTLAVPVKDPATGMMKTVVFEVDAVYDGEYVV